MPYITEKHKLKVVKGYDVMVIGGGPAGVAAAIASARNRAKTLLIEQTGSLGGMSTTGLMPNIASFGKYHQLSIKGIGLEIVDRLKKMDGCHTADDGVFQWISNDKEKLKVVYDDMIQESGADVWFFTFFSGVIKKGKKITHAIIENKSGRQAIQAKVFIDTSGDADVAALAGAAFVKGDTKGNMQPASLCIVAAGIDRKKSLAHVRKIGGPEKMRAWWKELIKKGKLAGFNNTEYRGLGFNEIFPGFIGFNFGHQYAIDGTNARDLSKVMTVGRKMARSFIDYGRKHIPGMEHAVLVNTAALPGIRETRRIKGEYEMTIDDYFNARHFNDEIAVFDNTIDVHNATKSLKDFNKFNNDYDSLVLPKGKTYGIRFGSLVPVGLDNLLVAGRSISSDRLINGSLRVMPCCFATGQAAGTAAAITAKKNIAMRVLSVASLRGLLRKQGAHLP